MKKTNRILSFFLALILLIVPLCGSLAIKAEAAGSWTCAWATSTVDSAVALSRFSIQDIIPSRSTLRIELKVTTGGERLKFKFSNEYGAAAITINAASVARTDGEGTAKVKAGSMATITFGGQAKVTVPAGKTVWSDEINYVTRSLESLSVSMYFDSPTYITSAGLSNARTFMGMSSLVNPEYSQVYNEKIARPREVNISSADITYHTTPFLCEIDTFNSSVIKNTAVFIGDSTLVNDAYYYFAERLVKSGITNVSVVNEAIVANKLLSDGTGLIGNLYGDALIERFERDALSIKGVKWVFVKIGLNDILHQFSKSMGSDVPHYSSADIINGYKKLVEMAHAKGIKIYFFTKTPWKGYERAFLGQTGDVVWNTEMQKMCDELDSWIKSNNIADGYIDCWDLANPADPYALCPSFTPDGAHLTKAASIALADLIPVSYVGVNQNVYTSASLNNIDPYKEKNQIIYDMEHTTEEATTAPAESDKNETTTSKTEETTAKPEKPTLYGEVTTVAAASGEFTTIPEFTYVAGENVTVPVIGEAAGTQKYTNLGVSPDYSVLDNLPESKQSGSTIMYMLILFTVVTVSGAALFMSMGRKKEGDFE